MMRAGRKREQTATTARIALWYAFSNVFVKGLAFISTPVFTRLMTKAEFGYFSNFTSWEAILAVIVTLDFTASVARAKYDFDDRMDVYLSSILLASNFVTLACFVIVELNSAFFTDWFEMDIGYIRLMFLYVMFLPAFSYLQAKHRIYRKYRFFVAFAISSAILRTGTAVVLVIMMKDKLLGRTIGYVIPTTLMNLVLWAVIIWKGRKIDRECVAYASRISIPLIPHAISGIILGSSDRIMITKFIGAEANAMYTVAYQVSLLANLLWNSMNQAWAPSLYDNIHAGNRERVGRNARVYLGVFAGLIVGVLLLSPELMIVMGGFSKKYYEARFVMPPVVMGCVFQFVYGMYVNLEIYAKKTGIISIGTVSAALLNIGLNAVFIPRYGYIAAAYTTLVGYAAQFAFHYIIVKVTLPELGSLYSSKFIFGVLAVLFACSAAALPIYRSNAVRYPLVAVYVAGMAVFVYRNRGKVRKLLGMRRR